MFDKRLEDPWRVRPEDCGYVETPTVYRPCRPPERLELRQRAAGREHLYRLLGSKPYTTKRGAETELLVWEGSCMDCGEAFELMSARKVPRYLTRRCQECRQLRDPSFY
jgi:hypothetical protein